MRIALAWLAGVAPLLALAQPCGQPTPADQEGPFYKAGAPARANLVEPGTRASRLVLTGVVRDAACRPVAGARVDLWHADEKGDYDNRGFRYRGVVTADAEGRYRIETILPPPYVGRPRHLHAKIARPGGAVLTTQLYFPGEAGRENPALVVRARALPSGETMAEYDFVLR